MWQCDVTDKLSIFPTSLILTFLRTVINSFLVPVHSTGNLIYTCAGHIRFSHTITLTSLITSLRPHLGVSPAVEGTHRPDLIWYVAAPRIGSKWCPSLLSASAIGWTQSSPWCFQALVGFPVVPAPTLGAQGNVYVEGIQAPSFIWSHLDECHSVQQTMASPRHNTALLLFKKGMSERE